MNNPVAKTVKFVRRHRVAVAVVTTTTVLIALDRARVNQWNDFLVEHELYNKFYEL